MFASKRVSARGAAQRGSWQWALRVAELTAWATVAIVFVVLQLAGLPRPEYVRGLVTVAGLIVWFLLLFRVLYGRSEPDHSSRVAAVAVAGNLFVACISYGVLRGEVPSAQLVFVPLIVGTGLLSSARMTVASGLLAVAGYVVTAQLSGGPPSPAAGVFNAGIFLLSAAVAGLLSRELRSHFRSEQEEHRLADVVRHRLIAVLDAIDEAVVFSDRQGVVRALNRRVRELLDVDEAEHLGGPAVHLLRTVARRTEDPEGFMEAFQELRDDPEFDLRLDLEQILPARRRLKLHSAPAYDESGVLVGRIDVYTDVSENAERAHQVAQLYEDARKTAESYQRALLPDSPPKLPRVSMVAHYVAAAGRRAVCGDFYDFVPLKDGRMAIVLGDVVGAGPQAATDAALARYTLRSFSAEVSNPARLLRWMNGHLSSHLGAERFVRMLICVLDPERAVLDYASAGHVPPIVHRAATGKVEWLEEGDLALGILENTEYKEGRVELEPGDLLVCYTDGVTEAPRLGRPYGQGRFADLVRMYGYGTPGELIQAVRRSVDAWASPQELRDDLALVVSQVAADASVGEPTRELVLPNEPIRTREIRRFVESFLVDVRAPVDTAVEILLAVGEAAANATRYGRRAAGRSEVRVRCTISNRDFSMSISDDGPGFDVLQRAGDGLPDLFASGGRGLFLMRRLSDEAVIDSTPEGTTVRLSRHLDTPPVELPDRGAT